MKLIDPTDTDLNEQFVLSVLKWSPKMGDPGPLFWKLSLGMNTPDFCQNPNKVMMPLEDCYGVKIHRDDVDSFGNSIWTVTTTEESDDDGYSVFRSKYEASGSNFAKCAVISMLRSHGVEIAWVNRKPKDAR